MKVVLVNASPHQHGCTYTALTKTAEALQARGVGTDIFWIGNKPISGCIACKGCIKKKVCIMNDKVNEFLFIAGDYNGFLFGIPVHWGNASGAITLFLNRVFYADLNGAVSGRVLQDKEGVQTMQVLGRNMAYLLKCQNAARAAGILLPIAEPFVFTNFKRDETI